MAQLAGASSVEWICLGVLLAVSGLLLFRTQRYFARQARRPPTYEPPSPSGRLPPQSTSPSLEHWEVEMHQLARELSARLDSKMSVLEHLIRDADRAAARLEAALSQNARPPRSSQAEALLPSRAAPDVASRGETAGRGPARRASAARYDEISMMADYGHPSSEIAARLGLPVGEVELILSLRGIRGKDEGSTKGEG